MYNIFFYLEEKVYGRFFLLKNIYIYIYIYGRLLFFLKNKILKTFDSRFLKRVIFFKLFEI